MRYRRYKKHREALFRSNFGNLQTHIAAGRNRHFKVLPRSVHCCGPARHSKTTTLLPLQSNFCFQVDLNEVTKAAVLSVY